MADYQCTFRGLSFGDGTDIDIEEIDGIFNRTMETSTPSLPRYHGGLVGASYHAPRVVTMRLALHGDPAGTFNARRRTIMGAFNPAVDVEYPLTYQLPTEPTHRLAARVSKVTSIIDQASEYGLAAWLVEFVASDPVIYADSESSSVLPVFAASAGLSYPVTYPKLYGASGTGSGTVVTNDGEWETWPTLTIAGPSSGTLTNPIVENVSTGKKIELTANGGVSITVGQSLIIETHPKDRSILFATGASRYGQLSVASEFWPLMTGDNELRFRASGSTTSATCTVTYRSAWI